MRKMSLPATSAIADPSARRFAQAVREVLEALHGSGLRDPAKMNRAVVKGELLNLDLARSAGPGLRPPRRLARVGTGTSAAPEVDAEPTPDSDPPPVPTGLTTSAGFLNVTLTWDDPDDLYDNHGVTEIWRAAVDDLAQATCIGATQAAAFTDARLGTNAPGFYWLRFVSQDDIEGDFNAAAGTAGATATTLDFGGVARAVNLPDPVDPQEPATRAYADAQDTDTRAYVDAQDTALQMYVDAAIAEAIEDAPSGGAGPGALLGLGITPFV